MAFGPFFAGEKIKYTLTIKEPKTGVPVDLTGYAGVNFYFRKDKAVTNKFPSANDTGTIEAPATNGVVSFDMKTQGGDVGWLDEDVGGWTLQLEFLHANNPRKSEKVRFQVEPGLAAT